MSRSNLKSNGLGKLQPDPRSHLGLENTRAAMYAMLALSSGGSKPAAKRWKKLKSKSR